MAPETNPTHNRGNACGHGTQAPGDQRRPAEPASGHRPRRDQRMGRVARRCHRRAGRQARPLRHAASAGARPRAPGRRTAADHHRLHQHHPPRARALVPRRRARRAPDPGVHPVERGDAGAPRAATGDRRRRTHLHLRQLGLALRGRLQPLLPGQEPPRRRRPHLLPGPRLPGHVRARLPRGAALRAPARRVPAGAVAPGRRPAVVPAPAADAGLLGVPDRLHGPRRDQRDLPGPVQPLPAPPGHQGHLRPARMGVPRRRRDGRGRSRSARSASPPARSWTTSPSSSTATCSGWTARSAATARSCRSWSRSSAAPAGT